MRRFSSKPEVQSKKYAVMPLEVKAFGCAPFAGKHAQRIVAVGHVKHLVLKKVRNSGRRVVHLSAEGEAPVRAAVIGAKTAYDSRKPGFVTTFTLRPLRSWPKYRSSPIFSYLLCFIAVLLTVSAQVIHRVADNAVCYIDNGLKLHAFDRLGKLPRGQSQVRR